MTGPTNKHSYEILAEVMPLFEEAVFAYLAEEVSPIDCNRLTIAHTAGERPSKEDKSMFHAAVTALLMQALDDAASYIAKKRGCKWGNQEGG